MARERLIFTSSRRLLVDITFLLYLNRARNNLKWIALDYSTLIKSPLNIRCNDYKIREPITLDQNGQNDRFVIFRGRETACMPRD